MAIKSPPNSLLLGEENVSLTCITTVCVYEHGAQAALKVLFTVASHIRFRRKQLYSSEFVTAQQVNHPRFWPRMRISFFDPRKTPNFAFRSKWIFQWSEWTIEKTEISRMLESLNPCSDQVAAMANLNCSLRVLPDLKFSMAGRQDGNTVSDTLP
jgi:hypothetical protein